MIDFDQFWAEPGCFPGMGAEETKAYMQQLAEQFGPQGAAAFNPTSDPMLNPRPGLSPEEIAAWESERGVQLPAVLREVYARQNGGFVYDTHLRLLPLEEIASPGPEFWDWASYEEDEIPDRGLIFFFAEDQQVDGEIFLNFNANGLHGEPAVMSYHSDPGDLNPRSKSVTKFLTRMLETFETPSVDWSEAERAEVVARETVDMSAVHQAPAQLEQILVRLGGSLVLFTRQHSPAGEMLSRTTLPEPLSKDMSMIDRHAASYALMLYPEESDGIVQLESKQTRTGRWKNRTTKGAPVYVNFESPSRDRLEALRQTLLGEKAAQRAHDREEKQQLLQDRLAAMSPEQNQAALMQTALQHLQRMREEDGTIFNPGAMPPEAAALHELMQQKLREIEQRTRERLDQHPPDPEAVRLMEEMMRSRFSENDSESP
ncbi:MAG TPA: SMI1/KNR4 family protein [Gemmataceae bacterium]|nr:SMI1/KNR4 family protein [Gemmataceae bacterium]